MQPPLYFAVYYDMPAITMNTGKAQRVLKFRTTDFATGLKDTYRWYLKHHVPPSELDFSFEDTLIAGS
jgi:hypothetical protein